MIFNSIRWRLQLWYALLLVIVLVGFGLSAYHFAQQNQIRRVDAELEQHLNALFRPPPPNGLPGSPRPGRPPGPPDHGRFDFRGDLRQTIQQGPSFDQTQTNVYYYILWQQNGERLAASPNTPLDVTRPEDPSPSRPQPADFHDGPPGPHPPLSAQARTWAGQARQTFSFGPGGECVLVGRSLAPERAAMSRLALGLTAAGVSVLLIGLAGGWWVSSRAIRPIEDISATATKIAGGDLSHRINAANAGSELDRLVTILNSTFARLEASFAQQARFTADASHELRTPITVILTQTQMSLTRERSPAEYREVLSACERAARRMRSLTESLLELARLDAGQEQMQAPFDLVTVVHESIELIRPLAQERGIQIKWTAPAPVQCVGNGERMAEVVTNLLTNALQFNHDHGTVCVNVDVENDMVLLTVADTGAGIPAEDLPHIFERFYRVDKSRSRQQGHDGLGLAICKAIVESHGGQIDVVSHLGQGTIFKVKLPLTR